MESKAHAWEILSIATRGLATATDALSQHLRYAYTDGLHQLTPDRFPWLDLREPLRDILDYFKVDSRHASLIVERLGEDEQRRIAREIFELYVEVCKRDR
jgi:hypothetical protein